MHSLAMALGQKALVLKEFKINLEGEKFVHIVARNAGLISWLMTLLGIDTTTRFYVYADRIEFQQGSLSGQLSTVLPLSSVSITRCGYMKPFLLLLVAVIFVVGAVIGLLLSLAESIFLGLGIVLLVLGIVAWIFYFLYKNMLISVVSNSGWPIQICFKRSVIEGVKVEYEEARQVVDIINQLLMVQNRRN